MHYIVIVGEAAQWHIAVVTSKLKKENLVIKPVYTPTLEPAQLKSMVFEPAPQLVVKGKQSRFIIDVSDICGLVSSQTEWNTASAIFNTCEEVFPCLRIWAVIQPDKSLEILHGRL